MSFPHADVLHGDPCDCTLHDLGLNCSHKLTSEAFRRELDDLVSRALRSGFSADAVAQMFSLTIEWYREQYRLSGVKL